MSTGPSLYRRHRPRTFADVVGQEQIVRTLSNAVQRNQVHHAYLFVGSRGTGKTSTAKILAACLNCINGPTISPCGVCDSCVSIASATSLDVIEMDAASNNSVDDIRDLRERVAYAPVSGRHKVYILDEAHMLSSQAWNAFLKTLEEPPPRTIFVLATTEAQKVLPTVVDRCHRFDFGRPTVEQIGRVVSRVATSEQIDIEPAAAALIARHATGSFRDALGTLEQLLTYAGSARITAPDVLAVLGVADYEQLFEALDAVLARDPAQALRCAATLTDAGRDPGQILRDLEVHGRELLAVQVLGEVPEELRMTPERDARLLAQAQALSGGDVIRLLDLVAAALEATANGAQARIQLELVLVKCASPQVDPSTAALLARIEQLEHALRRLGAGGAPAAAPPPPRGEPAQPAGAPAEQGPAPAPAESAGAPVERAPAPAPAESAGPPVERAPAPAEPTPVAATGTPPPAAQVAPPRPAQPADEGPTAAARPSEAAPPPLDDGPLGGPPSLESLTQTWPAVVDFVGQANAMLAAALKAATPVSLAGETLTLAFPAGGAFLKRKAEQDDYRRATADALRSISGARVRLQYELREESAPAPVPVTPDADGDSEEIVRRFVEEFDAEEVLEDPDQEEAR